jgi:hypothetical protein
MALDIAKSCIVAFSPLTPCPQRPSFVDQIGIKVVRHTIQRTVFIRRTLAQPLLIGVFWLITGKHWTRRIFCRVEDHSNERMTSSWLGCTGLSSFPWYEHGFSKYHIRVLSFSSCNQEFDMLAQFLVKNGCDASCRKIILVCNTNRDSTLVTAMV